MYQDLFDFEIANNKSSESDNDFHSSKVNSFMFCGGGDGVVHTIHNSMSLSYGCDCGFEHDPHTSSVDYKGHLGDQVPLNVNTQCRNVVNAYNAIIMPIYIYNNENVHSHNTILSDTDVHADQTTVSQNYDPHDQDYYQAAVSFTNFGYQSQDHRGCIVYIHGSRESGVRGYFLYQGSHMGDHCALVPYTNPIEGALYVIRTMTIHMRAISRPYVQSASHNVGFNTPEVVYDNYSKDIRSYEYYGYKGPRWQSGNTLAFHLCGRGSIPVMAVSGKAGSCLPLVGSLQYRTLANYMYWFPLPFQLPVVI